MNRQELNELFVKIAEDGSFRSENDDMSKVVTDTMNQVSENNGALERAVQPKDNVRPQDLPVEVKMEKARECLDMIQKSQDRSAL